jgi:hypothetical protein
MPLILAIPAPVQSWRCSARSLEPRKLLWVSRVSRGEFGILDLARERGALADLGWKNRWAGDTMSRHERSPPRRLFTRLSDRYPHQHLAAFSRGTSIHINGMGNAAQEWAALLEQLTLRSDLHQLTLHWWLGDLFSRGHLRTYPAWCTACYTAWTE